MRSRIITDAELDLRLANIEEMQKQILLLLEAGATPSPEIRPGSAMPRIIARELVNSPDLYIHRRKTREAQ